MRCLFFLLISTSLLYPQDAELTELVPQEIQHDHAISVGILQGGGSLIGVDYEKMINGKIGVQIGAGIVGFGAGINYHLEKNANSDAISLQFWNQGTSGDQLSQRALGITYIYRNEINGLTAQIGLGGIVTRGKLMDDYYKNKSITNPPAVILLYSLGWVFY